MSNTKNKMEETTLPEKERTFSFAEAREKLDKLDLTAKIGRNKRKSKIDLISGAVGEWADENEIWNLNEEAFAEIGAKKISTMLERIEGDFEEREKLIPEIKGKFKEANRDDVIGRHLRLFVIPDMKHVDNYWDDDYFISRYARSFLMGDLDFLELLDLDDLRKISDELDKLAKSIDLKKIEEKEKEERTADGKEKFKEEKREKDDLADKLAKIFYYKGKLLEEVVDFLGINMKTDNARDRKKLKNQFQNMKLGPLREISELYSKIVQKTESLAGSAYEEEDLRLGFEDLREGK